ncbi:MAG: cobyrinic acid a,c-diamide synthase, partial [Nitrospirae bacterium]|nr:cobyrinic acid a,c-diamide synthase [Nitrospirota bacterium]
NRIWEILGEAGRLSGELRRRCGEVRRVETAPAVSGSGDKIRVGIVRDSAFQFYYPENFEELQRRGASLIEISAMKEKKLPALDALYIGGGFPETHAIALARNKTFRKSLQEAVESGLPVYAECGGLMYLGEAIILDRRKYPMTGIFPVTFSLERRPQAHGYTVIDVTAQNPFYERGSVLKGHEFHYSRVVDIGKKKGMKFAFSVRRGQGIVDKRDGICYKNVLATYTHLHALGSPEWAEGLLVRAMAFHKKRKGSSW